MKPYWNKACELLRVLAYLVKELDPDGVDLVLANENKKKQSSKSSLLKKYATSRIPQEKTPSNLQESVSDYLDAYCNKLKYSLKKGLRIYILTTGYWLGEGEAGGMDQPIRMLLETMKKRKKNS